MFAELPSQPLPVETGKKQMARKRVRKKLHKFWLQRGVIDASQVSYWRKILFNAEYNEAFPIDKDHLEDLWSDTAKAIQRLDLRYMVAKVPSESTEPWLSEGGLVIFKFWAVRHPSVKAYSGNNPDVI